jgi:uncharacterized protein (TIGR02300 family)
MVKPELGLKRICVSCSTRFYDLSKVPAICPKCGTEQPLDQPKPKRGGNTVERRAPKKAAVLDENETDAEVEATDDEAEEGVLESTDDLDDDADAIGGELEVEPDNDEAER